MKSVYPTARSVDVGLVSTIWRQILDRNQASFDGVDRMVVIVAPDHPVTACIIPAF